MNRRLSAPAGVSLRQFGWKLALSYTLVTLAALLLTILVVGLFILPRIFVPGEAFSEEEAIEWDRALRVQFEPLFRSVLAQEEVDGEAIASLSALVEKTIPDRAIFDFNDAQFAVRAMTEVSIAMVDPEGKVLGFRPSGPFAESVIGRPLDGDQSPGLADPLAAALAGEEDPDLLIHLDSAEEAMISVVPVQAAGDGGAPILGAVVISFQTVASQGSITSQIIRIAGRLILLFVAGVALLGVAFGFLTAGRMVNRFDRVSRAAAAWSQGDFNEHVGDLGGDEIGQLARSLDGMAAQLADLLEEREELAVSGERNRLARDLHDSAKQQAFAASGQLAAAVSLYEVDPGRALPHVLEAQKLVDRIRLELTGLILELRPADLKEGGLPIALSEYAAEWAHQSGVEVDVQLNGRRKLPPEVEQALLRIAQEALANIARHARAGQAIVRLDYDPERVTMTIADNGNGFEAKATQRGFGLRSMAERAEKIEARLDIASQPEAGTRITVTLENGRSRTADEHG